MKITKSSDIKIASKIASGFLDASEVSIKPIGEGSNNKNFLAKSKNREVVIKLSFDHKEYKAFQDYIKEKWCIEKSSEKGVPGPIVLDLGQSQERSYMIETFVHGINGKKLKNKLWAYYQLGRYTKRIHSIKVSGFGENLTNPRQGIFKGSWQKYLDYNIKSLTDSDKLIGLKVLSKDQSKEVKKVFQNIKKIKYTFGLNHGDVSIWNTLVEKSGKVNLLDWGSAEVHIIPHYDFIHIVRCQIEQGRPSEKELNEFIKGYGMSQKEFGLLKPELIKLMLLISFDKLRWAIDRNPTKIKEFSKRAKMMLKLNVAIFDI
ncbi:MAG: aminoglycoside phosphotransferase family protein [bacterium]|nr:aminoglycoside phosphotransferase family protein [bacterium]